MSDQRILDRLGQMRAALSAIERLTADKSLDDYAAEPDLAAAVERYLERLSEASRHVPDALKEKHPNIDWRGVADSGNVLRHAYDRVMDHRIWQIVTADLAPLKAAVETMLREVKEDSARSQPCLTVASLRCPIQPESRTTLGTRLHGDGFLGRLRPGSSAKPYNTRPDPNSPDGHVNWGQVLYYQFLAVARAASGLTLRSRSSAIGKQSVAAVPLGGPSGRPARPRRPLPRAGGRAKSMGSRGL